MIVVRGQSNLPSESGSRTKTDIYNFLSVTITVSCVHLEISNYNKNLPKLAPRPLLGSSFISGMRDLILLFVSQSAILSLLRLLICSGPRHSYKTTDGRNMEISLDAKTNLKLKSLRNRRGIAQLNVAWKLAKWSNQTDSSNIHLAVKVSIFYPPLKANVIRESSVSMIPCYEQPYLWETSSVTSFWRGISTKGTQVSNNNKVGWFYYYLMLLVLEVPPS